MADEQQQSNVKQEYNYANAGLNMDQTPNQIPKGKLTYALNAAVENFDSNSVNYQNEPGNELCLNFPEGFHVIGHHFINEQNKHIFFLTKPETGESEIGYMENNDCIYHTFISGACLNFSIKYPILKTVHKITNCTTEVYWTDGVNPRRYIDLDPEKKPYITQVGNVICDVITTPVLDCNKLKVQPNFSIPELTVIDVLNTGDLTAGTYQFAIQYCDIAGDAYTSYYSITNPTPIANPQLTTPDFNYQVGKAIVVNVSNIDTTGYFQYFNLAVIKTVNGVTSVELVGTYFIDELEKQITYNGQNKTNIRLTVDDVFEKYPYYEVAQDVTAVQDLLVWDNLSSIDRINYQRIANQISLQWQTYRIPNGETYSDELNATNLRGYLRDEVYAFEIVFLLANGKQTDGFHIPGREKNANELGYPDIYYTDPDYIETGIFAPYWKIYNTASVSGPAVGPNIGNATPYEYGEFAYWESEETYPCNEDQWGELAGTPIRHHKFPDVLVSPIFESADPYIISGKYSVSMKVSEAVFPIGVKIDITQIQTLINNSDLTAEQKSEIVGFKIVRGDRSDNKSIVGKGILRNVGKYSRNFSNDINNAAAATWYYFPNYPYNDISPDPFLTEKNNAYNRQCYPWELVIGTTTTLTYTDCYTNTLIQEHDKPPGTYTICSTTTPYFTNPGDGTVTTVFTTTYAISVKPSWWMYALGAAGFSQSDVFAYTDPQNGPSVINVYAFGSVKTVQSTTFPVKINGIAPRYTVTVVSTENPLLNYLPNKSCYPNQLDAFSDVNKPDNTSSQQRFVFNSPETSFGQPFLGDVLRLESAIYGAGRGHFVQVKKHANYKLLTIEAQKAALDSSFIIAQSGGSFDVSAMFAAYQSYLQIYINGITRRNYTYSYNSIASYDYSAPIANGIQVKQRKLDLASYLIPGVQNIGDNYNINNYQRESSVYLKTNYDLPFPANTPSLMVGPDTLIDDISRFTLSDVKNCENPENEFNITTVTYYASLKKLFPNQWGQMYSYNTIDTGYQQILDKQSSILTVFGGDTFISRFSFKTKLPFFIDNRVNAPDDSDIFYDEIGNVAYPVYWFSSRSVLFDYEYNAGGVKYLRNIISIKAHNFDCANNQSPQPDPTTNPPIINQDSVIYDGKMYLFAYGIPTFYCESSINVDLRQAFNSREGDFFPHVSSGIPDEWLQESFVPIAFDNTYNYNITYSKQNKENFFSHLPIDWKNQLCYTNFPFRTIYSERQQSFTDNRINSWLIYKPLSFFDFPQNYGKLVSLDGIQNRAILARFENKTLLYNNLLTIDTSNPQAAYVGNPDMFKNPPVDFAETDLGYIGSQNKFLLKIPQGQITIDAKRGQVFLLSGAQSEDLSAFGSGLNRFFTDHLAFEILRYFPDADIDNNFNGIGLHGVYDSKYDRVIITKLDYIPQNEWVGKIKYDSVNKEFYIEEVYPQSPTTSTTTTLVPGTTTTSTTTTLKPLVVRKNVQLTDPLYFCNKGWTLSFNMNTKSWISFHSYIPNFYMGENNFFYSGLNTGCDFDALAAEIISTTTSTTTVRPVPPISCNLAGTARTLECNLEGWALSLDVCDLAGIAIPILDCGLVGTADVI